MSAEIEAAVKLLAASGYLVAKIPPCNRSSGHGRHILLTRSAACEGAEPMPHGYHSGSMGSFGYWINCQCGRSFADYSDGGEPTPWKRHEAEFVAASSGVSVEGNPTGETVEENPK